MFSVILFSGVLIMKGKNSYFLGVVSAIVSSVFFGMLGIFSSIGETAGLSTTSRIFFRFFIAAIVMYFIVKAQGKSIKLGFDVLYKLTIGSILYFSLTSYLLFRSYDYIGTGFATVLSFTYPIMVLILSIVIDREKVGKLQLFGTAIAFVGLLIVIGPIKGSSIVGISLGILSAITFTLYIRMLGQSFIKKIDSSVLMFYIFMISAVFWFFPSTYEMIKTPQVVNIPRALISVVGLSVLGSLIACTLFTYSVKAIGGRMTSILSVFNPIASVLIGLVVLNEKLASGFGYGVLLILFGTIMVSVFEKKQTTIPIEDVLSINIPTKKIRSRRA
jgi:drug/metabolite transporter (DMT)-like permease